MEDMVNVDVSEIEVTPKMIEAEREEIAARWLEFTSIDEGPLLWDEVLTSVFRAMTESQPKFYL